MLEAFFAVLLLSAQLELRKTSIQKSKRYTFSREKEHSVEFKLHLQASAPTLLNLHERICIELRLRNSFGS